MHPLTVAWLCEAARSAASSAAAPRHCSAWDHTQNLNTHAQLRGELLPSFMEHVRFVPRAREATLTNSVQDFQRPPELVIPSLSSTPRPGPAHEAHWLEIRLCGVAAGHAVTGRACGLLEVTLGACLSERLGTAPLSNSAAPQRVLHAPRRAPQPQRMRGATCKAVQTCLSHFVCVTMYALTCDSA